MSILAHQRREKRRGPALNRPLYKFFHPEVVAVIGATETAGAVGSTVFQNLASSGFKGRLYPVNPKRPTIHGHKAFPSLAAVPENVDLAVIVTPAQSVPDVIRQCADLDIENTVIISAGFKEIGSTGAQLEREVLQEAQKLFSLQQGTQEVLDKVDACFAHGIKSCWVVSPPLHTIQILTADGRETVLNTGIATDPITGLTADLSAVFS